MSHADEIRSAYRLLGRTASFYDTMMTCSTLPGTAVSRIVWDIGPKENLAYLERALAGIPEDFSGRLLEVPVGTGVLTMPVYRNLPKADITCLDYSSEMMRVAQERAQSQGIENVRFVQGDVGALPFENASFDIVCSLNGFHAFPDKEAAFLETYRVLKPGGTFCGCFYVADEVGRTDLVVRHLYVRWGYFTPPFETAASLRRRLMRLYTSVDLTCVRSEACFACVK